MTRPMTRALGLSLAFFASALFWFLLLRACAAGDTITVTWTSNPADADACYIFYNMNKECKILPGDPPECSFFKENPPRPIAVLLTCCDASWNCSTFTKDTTAPGATNGLSVEVIP